jgi:hypothetical protein
MDGNLVSQRFGKRIMRSISGSMSKEQEDLENCTVRSFIICTPNLILLE